MTTRGEPLYKTRPVAPAPALFGRCTRINDIVSMSEGFSNTYLIETPEGNVLINSGMGMEAPVHHGNFSELAGEIDGGGIASSELSSFSSGGDHKRCANGARLLQIIRKDCRLARRN